MVIKSTLALSVFLLCCVQQSFAAELSLDAVKALIETEVMVSSEENPYEDMGVITTNKGLTLQTQMLNSKLTEQTHKGQVSSKCFMISGPASRIWTSMPKDKEIRIDVISPDGELVYSEACVRREPAGMFSGSKFKCSSCNQGKH